MSQEPQPEGALKVHRGDPAGLLRASSADALVVGLRAALVRRPRASLVRRPRASRVAASMAARLDLCGSRPAGPRRFPPSGTSAVPAQRDLGGSRSAGPRRFPFSRSSAVPVQRANLTLRARHAQVLPGPREGVSPLPAERRKPACPTAAVRRCPVQRDPAEDPVLDRARPVASAPAAQGSENLPRRAPPSQPTSRER